MGRGFGFLEFFLVLILLLFVGGAAYSLGLAAGQAPTPAETGTVVYPVGVLASLARLPVLRDPVLLPVHRADLRGLGRRRWGGGGPGWGAAAGTARVGRADRTLAYAGFGRARSRPSVPADARDLASTVPTANR